ncbi:MAG: 3-deoxy-manno-octulosonate cytidylyltransferase [Pseudomonadales bacterium]
MSTTPPFNVVIPARYGSSRLPGKPLADIGGQPMIVRVARQALASGAGEVVVATDDQRIVDVVAASGGRALLTRADHPSGSDRVMEVADALAWSDDTIVINVQGDEPLIPPAVIAQVASLLDDHPATGVATLCEPIDDAALVFDPNAVKVVFSRDGLALYFSRAPIPYARDSFGESPDSFGESPDSFGESADAGAGQLPEQGRWYRHIGIYGYRLRSLRHFVGLPLGNLERLESLEQLRLLEEGVAIRIAPAIAQVPGGVDNAADLERVRRMLAADR